MGVKGRLGRQGGLRARRTCSDSEDSPLASQRGEENFTLCQTTSCPIPLKGGREDSVIMTESVNGCYFNNLKLTTPRAPGETKQS